MDRRFARSVVGALLSLLSLGGCGGSKRALPSPSPPTGGGTGAFGITTVGGTQKLYLPLTTLADGATTFQIAVVNVGVTGQGTAGAPALVKTIDLGTAKDHATTTGGDASVIVAASTDSPMIWFIDPTTDTLISSITLDSSYGRSDFSGSGGYVTGIAMDSARHQAVLSVWNGFAIVDTVSRAIVRTVLAAPSEKFGYDASRHRILAPFYDCLSSSGTGPQPPCSGYPITQGLNVIELDDDPASVYTLPTLISEPDSAAVDPTTGVVVVPSEGAGNQNVIDLSAATFDKDKGTVSAPRQVVAGSGRSEGVSIDSVEHLAFFEGEGSSNIGIMDLVPANAGQGRYLSASMPALPTGGGWSNVGDPHGIAVTTGILDGAPVGFVVNNSRQWVARVDLRKVLALLSVEAGTAATVAPAVTFLDAQKPIAP